MSLTPSGPAAGPPEPPPGPPPAPATGPAPVDRWRPPWLRWLRAVCAGVVVATVAATAAWFVIPTSTYVARTLMLVPPPRPYLFQTAEPIPSLGDHQRTQVAYVKSRLVLNAALKRPGVAELTIVRSRPAPVEWLEEEVRADFSIAPTVLRIAVTGDSPDELKTLVNALRAAYVTEVVGRDRADRNERLGTLGKLRAEYAEKLRARRRADAELSARRRPEVEMIRAFLQMQLTRLERELVETKVAALRTQAELKALRAGKAAGDAVGQLETRLATDMATQTDLTEQVDATRQNILKVLRNTKEEPQYDGDGSELTVLEEMTKGIAEEESKLRFECEVQGSGAAVIEEATAEQTVDVKRLVMVTGGAFVGTFALVVLGIAWSDSRARRIDPSANV